MARAVKVKSGPPASAREVRAYLLEQDPASLPEGVSVGARGRLSTAAKEYFTNETGREILVPETVSAE